MRHTVKNNILRQFSRPFVFLTFFLSGFLFVTGCTKQNLQYKAATGLLSIYLDWGTTPPQDILFYLYPQGKEGNVTGGPFVYECNSREFRQTLPPGDYKILLCTANALGVSYEGMDNLATARVCAVKRDENGCIEQPSNVFSANTCHHSDILHISVSDTLVTGITPVSLTKAVTFKFGIKNFPSLTGVSGILKGVVSAVNLFNGTQEATPCSHMFETGFKEGNYIATVHIFDLITKQEKTPVENSNVLALKLEGANGKNYNVTLDISKTIHDIKQANNGIIPASVSIFLELALVDGNIRASVSRWTNGSGSGSVN